MIITGIIKVILAYNPGGHSPLYGAADIWVTLHAGMAIVCACLPILKPLVTRFNPSASSTKNSTVTDGRYGTSEPDGWNIIHLDVGNSKSNSSVYSLTPSLESHGWR